jgi:hypothetical protein
VKSPREKVAKALQGDYRPEHVFTLKQSLDGYRYYQKLIAELDREIQRLMQTLPSVVETGQEIPQRTKHSAFQRQGNDPGLDLRGQLYRIACRSYGHSRSQRGYGASHPDRDRPGSPWVPPRLCVRILARFLPGESRQRRQDFVL